MYLQSMIYGNPDYYPPMINAAEVFHQQQVRQLLLCLDFTSAIWPQPPINYPPSTQVVRLRPRVSNSFLKYLAFCGQTLRHTDRTADWLIAYNMHALVPARIATWLSRQRLAYHSHDYLENSDAHTLSTRLIKAFERLFARTADLVIVPDQARADLMARELNLPTPPVIVANAALHAPLQPSDRLAAALAERGYHFDKVVFRPGRVGRGHALDSTIRSLPLWANPRWGFVVMGPCPDEDRHWLEQLAVEVGVADRFVILPAVSYTQVLEYASGADLGHGLYEPIHVNNRFITTASNKIMEYIAVGLPLLLSESEGNRALVDAYDNGLIVSYDDPAAIAAGVNQILGDEQRAAALAAGSRRAFQEEFNYARQLTPVIEQFKALSR